MTEEMKRERPRRRAWWTLARRRWAYGVLTALTALLVIYGVVTSEEAAAWLVLGSAVLGITGLALSHPTSDDA